MANSGWNTAPRTDRPTPTQVPPPRPVTPPPTPTAPAPTLDYDKLAEKLVEKMASDGRFRGPKGDPGDIGPAGPPGPPGEPGKSPRVDEIAAAVLAKMPPVVIQFTDKSGQVVEELPFAFDAQSNRFVAQFKPLPVEVYDASGKVADYDEYAIPWGIKLKPIVIDKEGNPVGQRGL